jgi:hypothetical protein
MRIKEEYIGCRIIRVIFKKERKGWRTKGKINEGCILNKRIVRMRESRMGAG